LHENVVARGAEETLGAQLALAPRDAYVLAWIER
jgi:hypothetical protein